MEYEAVIGLEVHLHLATQTKAFCGCANRFGAAANTLVCPVCLGLPGSLPVLNKKTLEYAARVALALNCEVKDYFKFDRKNYYYPDLPKNYQISQYDLPLSINGYLDIELNQFLRSEDRSLLEIDTERPSSIRTLKGADLWPRMYKGTKRIHIRRVHLEEDAGKLIHMKNYSLVDYNRSGIPLLEIVTEPDLNSPQEAYEYLTSLKAILEYLDVSDCDMEKGSLRCDANISVRKKGATALGTKTELKNMNSFKAVKDALDYEITRLSELLDKGADIIQETRLWNSNTNITVSMRSKEEAHDYRYFPDPDLVPFTVDKTFLERIKETLPESPHKRRERFQKQYSLSPYDSGVLISSRTLADYFEECVRLYPNPKTVSNWITTEILSYLNENKISTEKISLEPKRLVRLLELLDSKRIGRNSAKEVLRVMLDSGKDADTIIKEKNLFEISDETELVRVVDGVISNNAASVKNYWGGKENALMFLVGQVMKETRGKANPHKVNEILRNKLKGGIINA